MNYAQLWRLLVLGMFLSFFASPQLAYADDSVDRAIDSLKANPVYVADGTPGTTPDTAPQLARRLRDNDHLLIVMLPAPIGEEVSDELLASTLARIDHEFDGKKIIGLTIGPSAAAAGPTLPAGVASTLMIRAETVGTTPTETLGSFIVNVHDWQVNNPEPAPPPPPKPDVPMTEQVWFRMIAGALTGLALSSTLLFVKSSRKRRRASFGNIRFTSPARINRQTKELLRQRELIHPDDFAMRGAIMRVCAEVEAYFTPTSNGNVRPTEEIEKLLEWAKTKVVGVYLKLQDTPTYYPNAIDEKRKRVKAMEILASRMHNSVQNMRSHELEDVELDLMELSEKEK